ncbi:MAG: NUDIX domain-containing protein [Defluviitaleaceae bacterium]|nr:NUDIX domain-containing protein [Defluviitaleaceae bacterium]
MEIISLYDLQNYDNSWKRTIHKCAYGIVFLNDKFENNNTENKIVMMHRQKHDFFAIPGGKAETGETLLDALIREFKEETGLILKPSSIKELGKIIEIRKDKFEEEMIYERHEHYYFCEIMDIKDIPINPRLTPNEIESGYQIAIVDIKTAIKANQLHIQKGFDWMRTTNQILTPLA